MRLSLFNLYVFLLAMMYLPVRGVTPKQSDEIEMRKLNTTEEEESLMEIVNDLDLDDLEVDEKEGETGDNSEKNMKDVEMVGFETESEDFNQMTSVVLSDGDVGDEKVTIE
jgi:hypothetical protein